MVINYIIFKYLIPDDTCVDLQKGGKDPFGNYMDAYVVVHYNVDKYDFDYYFTFIDDAGFGMELTKSEAIPTNGKNILNPPPVTKDTIVKQTTAIVSVDGSTEEIKDMKYIKDDRTLKTKEELSEIPEEWFNGIRADESPDSIEQIISDYNFCKER